MRSYSYLVGLVITVGAFLIWNIVYMVEKAKECGPPYYYCAYELTNTLP